MSYASEIIFFDDVSVGYNDRMILENVNFTIHKGEFVYLIGKTGAGKSSLLRLIYADLAPNKGTIQVGKFRVDSIRRKDKPFLRRVLGIVFQDFQLLPEMTVTENIMFVMRATGWKDRKKMKARASEVLMQVGLTAKSNQYPHQLSGGEQQRTVIARALVNYPLLILADEPTGNLDPEVTDHIMDVLQKINRSGTAILMATHEHDLIRRYPGRVIECAQGQARDREMQGAPSQGQ